METILSEWVTFNLWRGNKDPVADLMGELNRERCHVIVLQEAGNHHDKIRVAMAQANANDPGKRWRMVPTPRDRGARNNVILFRLDVLYVKRHRYVDMPNPRVTMDRWVAEVVFAYVANPKREVLVLGTHLHPHIEARPWWRLPRQDEARQHIDWLVWRSRRAARAKAVMVAADWNINLKSRLGRFYKEFPTRSFHKIKMYHNFERTRGAFHRFNYGTKGRRFIDAWFSRQKWWFQQTAVAIVKKRSDHNLVRVTVEVTL